MSSTVFRTYHDIGDYTQCPHCVAEGRAGFADQHFNGDGYLWSVCGRHAVRWLTAHEMWPNAIPDVEGPGTLLDLPVVEGTWDRQAAFAARRNRPVTTHEPLSMVRGCHLRCPHCRAEGKDGEANQGFNNAGILWGVCEQHLVRWYITREMLGFPNILDRWGVPSLCDIPIVEHAFVF